MTPEEIAEAIGSATTLVGLGVQVVNAVKSQVAAGDDVDAQLMAIERRKAALKEAAREVERQLLELEIDKRG